MKNRLATWLVLITVMILSLLFSGCGSEQEKSSGKVLRVGGTSSVTASLDPAKEWEGWYTVRYGIGETLFKLDKELVPQPWLAEKGERVDALTWKITLKDKVTFSNGTKMTPEKVIAALKRAGEKNTRAVSLKESEYTVEGNSVIIKTKEPYATLINDLTDPYATIIDVEGTKDFDKNPIGTGPFVAVSLEPNTKAVMGKNKNYWGGTVKTESVEYVKVADFNTLALAVQNGEVDIALDMSPQSAESAAKSDKVVLIKTTQPRTYQLYFNLEKMQDKAVRETIMYGVDKKTIGEKQLKGAVTPANGAFLDTSAFAATGLKARAFDVEKAKQILAIAGYKDTNGDGIVEKDGQPLVVKLSVYKRLAMESIATEMQAQLKKIGIQVEISVNEKANFFAPGNFEMGLYSVVTTPTGDPYAFLRDFLKTGGKSNFGKYDNAEVQEYLAALGKAFAKDERVDLVNKIQQQVIDDAAGDYIGFNNMHTVISKSVSGYETYPNDYYQMTKDVVKK